MEKPTFEIATWYDTWNKNGLKNLVNKMVPLHYATRFNLAFGEFVASSDGYTLDMNAAYAREILEQLQTQAPSARVYAGVGDTGLIGTVQDNKRNNNRSTANIVSYLQANGMNGICIDSEKNAMMEVPEFVSQLGPSFKDAGLGIAVSVPWPGNGPTELYGSNAVSAFNDHVDAVELQDYSSSSTPNGAAVWMEAGIRADILMGGVCSENSNAQTSLDEIVKWTKFALTNGLKGMFSWRLDNDHGLHSSAEDIGPTFTGAETIYDTVFSHNAGI